MTLTMMWALLFVSMTTLILCTECLHLYHDDLGPMDTSKLGTLLEIQHLLFKGTNSLPEIEEESYSSHTDWMKRTKKGSVSWLLAAAIRMCREYPNRCLRQRELGDRAVNLVAESDIP